jgi:hypothetical protein
MALASNRVIERTPLFPATTFDQKSGTVLPSGVTAPRPVTTTRLAECIRRD